MKPVIYMLLATTPAQRACYIGSTRNYQRRMWQHSVLGMEAKFVYRSTSTEFFIWAHDHKATVETLVLEEIEAAERLIAREVAWTESAKATGGWLMPGIRRWGAKQKKQHEPWEPPDFSRIDMSRASPLIAYSTPTTSAPAGARPHPATDAEAALMPAWRYAVRMLVNPANRQPFFIGVVRPADGLLESGSNDEIKARAQVFLAIQQTARAAYIVDVEETSTLEAARHAKKYWIEVLLRSKVGLLNKEVPETSRQQAIVDHVAACRRVDAYAVATHPVSFPLGANVLDTAKNAPPGALVDETSSNQCQQKKQDFPARHGSRWSSKEMSMAKKMYRSANDISAIAEACRRKTSAVISKLCFMARSDSALAEQLRRDGLLDVDGYARYRQLPGMPTLGQDKR